MTKYSNEHGPARWEPRDTGVPISVRDYTQIEDHNERYCPYCQLKLSRLIDSSGLNPSWYCSKCTISYPDKSDTKSKSSLSTPRKSNNDNPLASTKFREPTVGKEPMEPKGSFAALKAKGIRITNYKDTVKDK
jgi:hypothetical protein